VNKHSFIIVEVKKIFPLPKLALALTPLKNFRWLHACFAREASLRWDLHSAPFIPTIWWRFTKRSTPHRTACTVVDSQPQFVPSVKKTWRQFKSNKIVIYCWTQLHVKIYVQNQRPAPHVRLLLVLIFLFQIYTRTKVCMKAKRFENISERNYSLNIGKPCILSKIFWLYIRSDFHFDLFQRKRPIFPMVPVCSDVFFSVIVEVFSI